MAILEAYNKITSSIDSKNNVIGIFLDLSKAFDTINHDILLSKLSHYGVRGSAFEWFKSHLSGRTKFTSFNNHDSTSHDIICGVPQGSILGPLLFILYLNDIVYSSKLFTFYVFSDDINLLASHKNLRTLIHSINNDLGHVSTWFKANKLSLNINKTNFMLFKNKHDNRHVPAFNITIDNTDIVRVPHTKFLGIILDECLTWKQHTTYIANIAVSKYTGILYRLKGILPSTTLFTLYNSLVLPHLMYCNIIWSDRNNTSLGIIHIKQKKSVRICTNSHCLAHSPPLFADLNTLTVQDINKLQTALICTNITTIFCLIYLQITLLKQILFMVIIPDSPMYRPCYLNTHLANNCIKRQGPLIWGSVPQNIRDSTSVFSFKTKFKAELISRY